MGANQTSKLLHSKGNHKKRKTKRQPTEWEEIVSSMQPTRAYFSKNTNNSYNSKTKKKKTKQPNLKMGRRHEQTFLQKRHTDCQQALEQMLNITNY